MVRSYTVGFNGSAISCISKIHRGIRDGDFEYAEEIIGEDYRLIGRANSIGWTALHFCASHEEIPLDRWRWMLDHSPMGAARIRTDMGHTCVDHFFFRYLRPLVWQRPRVRVRAKLLCAAIQRISQDDSSLDQIRERMEHDTDVPQQQQQQQRDDDDGDLEMVFDFWKRMEMLMRLHYFEKADWVSPLPILFALAQTQCPGEVAALALRLYPKQLQERVDGVLPLHCACSYPSSGALLACWVTPETARKQKDRLPLHVALDCGALTWRDVSALWNANPLYGGEKDAKTHLPAFLLACVPNPQRLEQKIQERAAQRFPGMWRFLAESSRNRTLRETKEQVELEHVETVFELLRAAPSVLTHCTNPNKDKHPKP